ncbi:MAG TPA: glycosyltransferase [Candidatus Wallbacteria bacterium]|nr:glycosyltransferase [Candidatus Wallbacteria bacterium]
MNYIKGLVSVVIPTYNRGNLISETIKSVIDQSYRDIEIIVVDDGSTDNTEEVIKNIKFSNLFYIKTLNSGRPAVPRNTGFKQSRGEYVAFLDSDDIWLPDKVKKQVEIFKSNPEIGIVFCQCKFFGKEYHKNKMFPTRAYCGNVFEKLITGNFVPTVSVLCRRDALENVGLFDESPGLKAFEDYELWMRIAHKFQFHYISEPLCLFRIHSHNILGTDNLKSHLGAFRALCSAINKIGFSEEQLKTAVSRHYLTTAMAWLETGNFLNFEIFIKKSLRLKPSAMAMAINCLRTIIGSGFTARLYSFYRSLEKNDF